MKKSFQENLTARNATSTRLFVAVFATMMTSQAVHAGSVRNGDFETGTLLGWDTIGAVQNATGAIGSGPASGTFQAYLTSNSSATASTNDLESFINGESGLLDSLANTLDPDGVVQGAAIVQTVDVLAGDTLTFDWNFLQREGFFGQEGYEPEPFKNDLSFLSVTSPIFHPEAILLADTFSTPFIQSAVAGADFETGYSTFTYIFTSSGTFHLGWGVMDVGDALVPAGFLLDNVTLEATGVPLPPAAWLGLAGIAGVAVNRRRKTI